jgi:RNA polymerase sigma factor (sigma-70 family)
MRISLTLLGNHGSMNQITQATAKIVEPPAIGTLQAETSDTELLALLSAGRLEAFWLLWNRYQKSIHQLCLQQMNGLTADAEDASSQIMLRALDRMPSNARKIIHVEAWLHRLAKNLCFDLRLQRNRIDETIESWSITSFCGDKNSRPTPHTAICPDADLQRRIAHLPELLRESFVLNVVEEIPAKEVAARLGVSHANVRKRVQNARKRLRLQISSGEAVIGGEISVNKPGLKLVPPPPVMSSKQQQPELFSTAEVIRTVFVKLPGGAEELFHVFPSKAAVVTARKISLLQSQVRQDPSDWKKRLELAEMFHLTGNWVGAVEQWNQVLTVQTNFVAVFRLGETFLAMGCLENAVAAFRQARRQNIPSLAADRHLDGCIALSQRDVGLSVREFRAAAALDPKNPCHWHGLALAHRLAGNMKMALTAIKSALRLNVNDLVALSLEHRILLDTGEIEEANRQAEKLLNLAPFDILTLQRLVQGRCQLGLVRGAAGLKTKRLLRRTLRLSKNHKLLRKTLAEFLNSQASPSRKVVNQTAFVRQRPPLPEAQRNDPHRADERDNIKFDLLNKPGHAGLSAEVKVKEVSPQPKPGNRPRA